MVVSADCASLQILEAHGITSAPDVTIQHPAEKHKHLNPTEPTTYRDPHRHGHEHTHGSPSGGVKTEDGRGGVKAEGMHLRSQDKHEDGGMKTRSQD